MTVKLKGMAFERRDWSPDLGEGAGKASGSGRMEERMRGSQSHIRKLSGFPLEEESAEC